MLTRSALQSRFALTACAFAAEVAHLGWEYSRSGVPAHHLLNDPGLPAISNWWGLVVVPLLVWFLVGRIQRRAATLMQGGSRERFRGLVLTRFAIAFLWAALLALSFTFGHPATPWIFFGAFGAALMAGAWRAEYVLGFALGMSFTFGAVLPVLIASVIAACAFTAHLLVRTGLRLVRGGKIHGAGLP